MEGRTLSSTSLFNLLTMYTSPFRIVHIDKIPIEGLYFVNQFDKTQMAMHQPSPELKNINVGNIHIKGDIEKKELDNLYFMYYYSKPSCVFIISPVMFINKIIIRNKYVSSKQYELFLNNFIHDLINGNKTFVVKYTGLRDFMISNGADFNEDTFLEMFNKEVELLGTIINENIAVFINKKLNT